MSPLPPGYRLETLERSHERRRFQSGEHAVDEWLRRNALQQQKKRLSTTRVLLTEDNVIAGYYTLAIAQIDFGDLPNELTRKLPRRFLPVAVLAWLGVDRRYQGTGLGTRLLARALRDCHEAGRTFSFVAVLIDAINADAKRFYERWSFRPLPGYPDRLFLSGAELEGMMRA